MALLNQDTWGWLPGIGQAFGNYFSTSKSPYDAASPYLNNISNTLEKYYSPFMGDPAEKINQFGSSFQKSPGFDFALKQALSAAGNAQAAGGMAGSPQHELVNMGIGTNLANQDYYNYLNSVMNQEGIGFNASNQLAQSIAANMMNQANLAYQNQDYENKREGGFWGGLTGALGDFLF